jgi:hypothetical protein
VLEYCIVKTLAEEERESQQQRLLMLEQNSKRSGNARLIASAGAPL